MMTLPRLNARIMVMEALIDSLDNLFNTGMKEDYSLDELQNIYHRLKQLTTARNNLLNKRKQVRRFARTSPSYLQLVQAGKEWVLN